MQKRQCLMTRLTLKTLSDRLCGRYCRFSRFKGLNSDIPSCFSINGRNTQITYIEKPQNNQN